MPLFYFAVDCAEGANEPVSTNLPSLAEAKCEAVRFAGELICDRATEFWDTRDLAITVTDETGLTLFSLHFSAVEAPAIRVASR